MLPPSEGSEDLVNFLPISREKYGGIYFLLPKDTKVSSFGLPPA